MKRWICVCAFAAAIGPAFAFAPPAKIAKTPAGAPDLQTNKGMTLYVFDGDAVDQGQQGRSSCVGECAREWPPFLVQGKESAGGRWSIVKRGGGSRQWAYKGRPLYTFSKDAAPGQTKGNGFDGNRWHVARP